ncbi:MAG TPA: phage holin family protein [Pseudonocardiaceae bacterium]
MTTPQYGTERPPADPGDASIGDLIGDVTRDLSTLMRQELELAKAELRQEAARGGRAAGALAGAGVAGHMVLLFLSVALWAALTNVMDGGWAGLIVAVLWAVIGAALYVVGRSQLRRVDPVPRRTVETLEEVPDALKGR